MAEGDAKTVRTEAKFGQGFLTDIWYFVCLSSDLRRGKLARHELHGEPVLLGRSNAGQLFALRDICPHRAAPLSAGRFHREASGAETVECPYHGWRFGADGASRAAPHPALSPHAARRGRGRPLKRWSHPEYRSTTLDY